MPSMSGRNCSRDGCMRIGLLGITSPCSNDEDVSVEYAADFEVSVILRFPLLLPSPDAIRRCMQPYDRSHLRHVAHKWRTASTIGTADRRRDRYATWGPLSR